MSTVMTASQSPRGKGSGIDYRFKILYALGMVFIVACHCGNGGLSLFYEWFPPYSFHLGLFAFCSGYFYKEQSENHVFKYCLKKAKHLLIPLYLWNVFYAVLVLVLAKFGIYNAVGPYISIRDPHFFSTLLLDPILGKGQFGYNLGGWFVAPLLFVQIANICIRRPFKNMRSKCKEHILICLYLLLGIAGCQIAIAAYAVTDLGASDALQVSLLLLFIRVLFFLPFFGLGIYYKKVLEKLDKLSSPLYFTITMLCALTIILIYQTPLQYTPAYCHDFTEGPIMPFVIGFLGIAFWLRIAKILEPAIGRSKTINAIADNSFSIMVNQFLGFFIVNLVYALLSYYSLIPDFDMYELQTNIFYNYRLRYMDHSLIIYLVAGIFIPVLMQRAVNSIKKLFRPKVVKE